MNKLIAILGVIVLLTIGALFFFAGFFTGSTVHIGVQSANSTESKDLPKDEKSLLKDIEGAISTDSSTLSDKIKGILGSAKDAVENTFSGDDSSKFDKISIDDLLREVAANHKRGDTCSPTRTSTTLTAEEKTRPAIEGKNIVFIGYFKNRIALEIQKLLSQKGYKVHAEVSKSSPKESFVFSGPFKKEANAQLLLDWLKRHNFSEARMVKIIKDAIEETIYDAANEESDLPRNAEMDIPEMKNINVPINTANQTQSVAAQTPQVARPVQATSAATPIAVRPTQQIPVVQPQVQAARPQIPTAGINPQMAGIRPQMAANPQIRMPGVAGQPMAGQMAQPQAMRAPVMPQMQQQMTPSGVIQQSTNVMMAPQIARPGMQAR